MRKEALSRDVIVRERGIPSDKEWWSLLAKANTTALKDCEILCQQAYETVFSITDTGGH